jgi:hypothetical protein
MSKNIYQSRHRFFCLYHLSLIMIRYQSLGVFVFDKFYIHLRFNPWVLMHVQSNVACIFKHSEKQKKKKKKKHSYKYDQKLLHYL